MKGKLLHCYIATLLQNKSGCVNQSSANNVTIQQFSNLKAKRAFTLVELIIYMALLGIFLLTLTDIFVAILNVQSTSQATSYVEQDGRYILARLTYALHSPMNLIRRPANLGDTDTTLDYAYNFIIETYSLSGDNLQYYRPFGNLTYNLNSSETKVTNLSFQKIGNSGGKETVVVKFTIQSKTLTNGQPEVRNFQTTIGRR